MSLLDILFPKTCLGCGRDGGYMCNNCLAKVKLLPPVCPYCEKASIDGFTHTKCHKSLGLDGVTSIWRYEGVVKKAISSLKYKYATEIVQELCGYYVEELNRLQIINLLPGAYCLIPIPIYWYRQNVRGFNQSEAIGKTLSTEIGWGFNSNLLYRKKSVAPQAGLTVKERKKNLKGVFTVNSNYLVPSSQSLILFDDVFTTGSTLHEACKVLKRSGVQRVWGLTIAR